MLVLQLRPTVQRTIPSSENLPPESKHLHGGRKKEYSPPEHRCKVAPPDTNIPLQTACRDSAQQGTLLLEADDDDITNITVWSSK